MFTKSAKLAFCGAVVAAGLSFAATAPANAQAAVMKECGSEWQAAKASGTNKPTDTWQSFLTECRVRKASATAPAATAPAATAPAAVNPLKPVPAVVPAPAPAVVPAKPPVTTATAPATTPPATGLTGRAAETSRQRACGAEWRGNKAAIQTQQPGITWPKYWSECNTRMKAAGK